VLPRSQPYDPGRLILRLHAIIFIFQQPRPCSRGFVNEERNFGGFEAEVHEPVALMHGMAAKTLSEEHVPVGLPALVHVGLNNPGNLQLLKHLCNAPQHHVLQSRVHQEPSSLLGWRLLACRLACLRASLLLPKNIKSSGLTPLKAFLQFLFSSVILA